MSKLHTPGPWEWDEYGNVTADGALIARVDWRDGGRNEPLIAAAPELLTALKVIAVWAENPESDATSCLKLIHDKAMNCIAKAKGEQE